MAEMEEDDEDGNEADIMRFDGQERVLKFDGDPFFG